MIMKSISIYHYDAFTKVCGKGNPAGIIFDADQYSQEEMQAIARLVGYNECCFVCASDKADLRLRYFTPGYETPLCGHATIAGITALMERQKQSGQRSLSVETLAGILHMAYDSRRQEVIMEQADAQFIPFIGNREDLAAAIGLDAEELDDRYPIVYGSTGSWTVIVPVKHLAGFSRMQPHNDTFPKILTQNSRASVHPITTECIDSKHTLHGRHFSSCYSGTVEDSVTGTASGVMGAYYIRYMHPADRVDLLVEQGNEIGREGTVHVWAQRQRERICVRIAGQAVKNGCFEVSLP